MKVLAVSYMLPPYLYPQAIQIGRLLNHVSVKVGAVCGQVASNGSGLDCYPSFDRRLSFRLLVPFKPRLSGFLHRLACYLLPFYGRSPDEFRAWVPRARMAVMKKLSAVDFDPDVLVTFGEPMSDHLLGLQLRESLSLPWVAHFSDPWSDNPFRRRFFLSNIINRRLEARVVEQADRVIFTSEETLDLVMRKYPAAWKEKARVLPHAFEAVLYPQPQTLQGPIVVRYMGNFYGSRSPRPLFEALAELERSSPELLADLRVELVGSVPARMLATRAYRCLPTGLVVPVPTVKYSKSLELMSSADALLVIDAPDEVSVFLPSKLIDYLGAGVPIMGIVPPGASARLIGALGGRVANPRRSVEVSHEFAALLAELRARRSLAAVGSWGDPIVRSKYAAEQVAADLKAILLDAATGKAAGG